MGLWMRHGQPGMEGDDTFDYTRDTAGMKQQREATLTQVRNLKDHPAVLAWGRASTSTAAASTCCPLSWRRPA
ncbi:hypothetical protein [Corallococcus macrosporus]|uniref:Uncharacterized protein n=1 Tax=Myxococcus fulvus (strain ATCC BAA-855 / HW-1) TaxID=483219 RepID=F8CAD4_MYXFH|nr:hypothetical protein [Corallococcus macrosporus]AEI64591.1 hypothetical protein LILAB_13430 [Corallococcus macrosporus]